jgi:dipeptidyl aminopeptidase/acylaminoacyl peptidase
MPKKPGILVASGLILLAGVCTAGMSAQAKRPMTLVDVLNIPNLTDPQLSPDGRQVAYVLAKADWTENKRISHIWRINADGTGSVQLTSGKDGETSPRWSPDGLTIAFIAKRVADLSPFEHRR